MESEPIEELDLIHRAADNMAQFIHSLFPLSRFLVLCGKGNNGADGLLIAHYLKQFNHDVRIHLIPDNNQQTSRSQLLAKYGKGMDIVESTNLVIDNLEENLILIDAILGMGLGEPARGLARQWIDELNQCTHPIISIDVPSGMPSDYHAGAAFPCVQAQITLSIEVYKSSFFQSAYLEALGKVYLVKIGLSESFIDQVDTSYYAINASLIKEMWVPRARLAEKRSLGSCLIVGGSKGMRGAAVLAANSACKSGCGLITLAFTDPFEGVLHNNQIMLKDLNSLNEQSLSHYDAILIGNGMNTSLGSKNFLARIIDMTVKPCVFDADALNIISSNNLLSKIPKGSMLTPHARELSRLLKLPKDEFDQIKFMQEIAQSTGLYWIIKGPVSKIFNPQGQVYFNTTGNESLACGGTGDVLAGLLAGLYARTGIAQSAVLLATYLHGLAADLWVKENHAECLGPDQLVDYIPQAYKFAL